MTNNGIEKNATKSKLTIKSVKINVYYSNSKRFSYPDAIHKTMLETRYKPFIVYRWKNFKNKLYFTHIFWILFEVTWCVEHLKILLMEANFESFFEDFHFSINTVRNCRFENSCYTLYSKLSFKSKNNFFDHHSTLLFSISHCLPLVLTYILLFLHFFWITISWRFGIHLLLSISHCQFNSFYYCCAKCSGGWNHFFPSLFDYHSKNIVALVQIWFAWYSFVSQFQWIFFHFHYDFMHNNNKKKTERFDKMYATIFINRYYGLCYDISCQKIYWKKLF